MLLFILIAVCSLLLQFFLPWWIIAPVAALLAAWKARNAKHAFFSALLAVSMVWVAVGLLKTLPNANLLAGRVALMLGLPAARSAWMIVLLVTSFIGGITAAVSALAGYYWRMAFKK